MKANFGDRLLFLCYEYMDRIHMKPESFYELFEFSLYAKTVGILKEVVMRQARAAYGS